MKRKMLSAFLCLTMVTGMLAGCGSTSSSAAAETSGSAASESTEASSTVDASAAEDTSEATQDFSGEELSILVS